MHLPLPRITAFVILGISTVNSALLADWSFCTANSQCADNCCSKEFSGDGKYKCTPGGTTTKCTGTSKLGDWEFCSINSNCKNSCCSKQYSGDGQYKCTPGGTASQCTGIAGTAPAPAPGPSGTTLYSGSGSGTYYYDVTGLTCNGQPRYSENDGYPSCTSWTPGANQKTLQQYGTNKIVAINANLISTPEGRAKYCGKQIKVFKNNGVEVSGGPFVVFDGCAACTQNTIIDFSVSALNGINGNACQLGVVPGLSWQVTNTQIIPFYA